MLTSQISVLSYTSEQVQRKNCSYSFFFFFFFEKFYKQTTKTSADTNAMISQTKHQ